MKKQKRYQICGEVMPIFCDKKIKRLNLELEYENNTPMIVLQDWTKKDSKDLVHLHIKEAIELKAVIDKLVLDYTEHQFDVMSDSLMECECK